MKLRAVAASKHDCTVAPDLINKLPSALFDKLCGNGSPQHDLYVQATLPLLYARTIDADDCAGGWDTVLVEVTADEDEDEDDDDDDDNVDVDVDDKTDDEEEAEETEAEESDDPDADTPTDPDGTTDGCCEAETDTDADTNPDALTDPDGPLENVADGTESNPLPLAPLDDASAGAKFEFSLYTFT